MQGQNIKTEVKGACPVYKHNLIKLKEKETIKAKVSSSVQGAAAAEATAENPFLVML